MDKYKQTALFELPDLPICSQPEAGKHIKAIERRVFLWGDESKADKKYFQHRIYTWLNDLKDSKSLTQLCWEMTWERNDEGKTCKYLYFSERSQRLYLDRHFFEWVKLMTGQIEQVISTVSR